MNENQPRKYNTLNHSLRNKFGRKVFKVSLNGNFTCPNKDGSVGVGGCIYCSESGSGDYAGQPELSLKAQYQHVKNQLLTKWPNAYTIAYFQANTNTYKSVSELKALFDEAITLDSQLVGLSIATRCDAINDDILDLLASYTQKTYLQVELGLQTIHDQTSTWLRRGHDLSCFDAAVKALRKRSIDVVVHIINGLKGENASMMLDTVKHLNSLDIQGIKIHMLHVLKNTVLEREYRAHPFPLLTLEQYVEITAQQIAHLRPDIVVHRVTGDAPKALLVAPDWILKKFVVMNNIDKWMTQKKAYQGIFYTP